MVGAVERALKFHVSQHAIAIRLAREHYADVDPRHIHVSHSDAGVPVARVIDFDAPSVPGDVAPYLFIRVRTPLASGDRKVVVYAHRVGRKPGPEKSHPHVSRPYLPGLYCVAEPRVLLAVLWFHVLLVGPVQVPVLPDVAIHVDDNVTVVAQASPPFHCPAAPADHVYGLRLRSFYSFVQRNGFQPSVTPLSMRWGSACQYSHIPPTSPTCSWRSWR